MFVGKAALVCAVAAACWCAGCGDGDGGGAPDATALPGWRMDLPPSSDMGARRGLEPARGIIHLHSPYSHDACDGQPRAEDETGPIDEDCLADLRAGLCATRMDFAALTDHDATMADEAFEDLFLVRGDDRLVMLDGAPIASRLACDGGGEVLLTVGGENPLMPIMLDRHVAGSIEERHAIYDGDDPAAVAAFREAGAVVWIPHTEQRTAAELAALAPDGVEVYQLHANLDPDIREEFLGLDPSGAIEAAIEFAELDDTGPVPDLALLSFLSESGPALAVWDALLAGGHRVAGSGGSDAHQNALPIMLRDGERGDSYRRVMRWFSNVVLAADRSDPVAIEEALRAGRVFVAFELMGTPAGFDVRAEVPGGEPVELGGTVAAGAGATLEVAVPEVLDLDPALARPAVTARVVHIPPGGDPAVVAEGPGPALSAPLDAPGAYRVEVRILPSHLAPYLGSLGPAHAEKTHPWIYASPVYVE
ncbi:MAG TPA: hypothetical protein VFU21_11665 [Kofleriaceae bacterium]|nr:hypothetical protein [Kofleriaceae bacterium]